MLRQNLRNLVLAFGVLAFGVLALGVSAASGDERMVLDGEFDDWREGEAMRWVGDHLWVQLTLPEAVTLQGAPETVILQIDADGDATTGAAARDGTRIGIDAEVRFSPRRGDGSIGNGASVALAMGGQWLERRPGELGVAVAPTYASDRFEIRLSASAIDAALESIGVDTRAGEVKTRFVLRDAGGAKVGASDVAWLETPVAARDAAAAVVPDKPGGAVRVVAYNVLRGAPMQEAERFGRLLAALDADVVLAQEWEGADAAGLESWFEANVGGEWSALTSGGWGVAVVSRLPMERFGPESLRRTEDTPADSFLPEDRDLRFVGGVVRTAVGPMIMCSLHLKCCGYAGSDEDLTRMAEADYMNETVRTASAAFGDAPVVIGGDFNLVGSGRALPLMAHGLDVDGSALAPAPIELLGDDSMITWRNPDSRFTPGRLDYVLVSDSALRVVNAFSVDTRLLDQAALRSAGLEADSTDGSDHLPLVVDLAPASR